MGTVSGEQAQDDVFVPELGEWGGGCDIFFLITKRSHTYALHNTYECMYVFTRENVKNTVQRSSVENIISLRMAFVTPRGYYCICS